MISFSERTRNPHSGIHPTRKPGHSGRTDEMPTPSRSEGAGQPQPQHKLSDAYQVLQYNQQLVQFADSKAGTLILINSLFIAAAQANHPVSAGLGHWLQAGYILLSSLAVLFCMAVVISRGNFEPSVRRDLVFFSDILARERAVYAREFLLQDPAIQLEGILHRTHVVASIASYKFARYVVAQQLTAASAFLWVAANALSLL